MLYLEGETSQTWPAVARILGADEQLLMVVQMYSADDPPPQPFQPSSVPQWLKTVTTFGDDSVPISSDPIVVDDGVLTAVATVLTGDSEEDGDFALYRPGEREWVAAAVPHERMVLVVDDSLLDALQDAGLPVSPEPPEWW